MNDHQLNRLRKDSQQLEHYIFKLQKQGRSDLAYKINRKKEYLKNTIEEITTQ